MSKTTNVKHVSDVIYMDTIKTWDKSNVITIGNLRKP